MDRRAMFFVAAGMVSIALAPATDVKHRRVPELLAILYVVLALLSLLDSWSRSRDPSPRVAHPDRRAAVEDLDLTRTDR